MSHYQTPYIQNNNSQQQNKGSPNQSGHHYDSNEVQIAQNLANQNQDFEPYHINQPLQQFNHIGVDEGHEEEYEALHIPPNWEMAKLHAESRRTGPQKVLPPGTLPQLCNCCGFQVQRQKMSVCKNDTRELEFLGSGFPCFYNWIKYSLFILIVFFLVSGVYNLYTNAQGSFCDHEDIVLSSQKAEINVEKEMKTCHKNFAHILSIANKINTTTNKAADKYMPTQKILNFMVSILVMIIMMFFRKSQRLLDADIDDKNTSPSDYTIIVKNIPKGQDTDYVKELTHIFTYNAVQNDKNQPLELDVTKVNLVYEIDYIIELEQRLAKAVQKKQEFLKRDGFRTQDPIYKDLESEIEHIEHRIHKLEESIPEDPQKYFSGIAFVSFRYEYQKDMVIEQNPHTFSEKLACFMNKNGQLSSAKQTDLTWDKNKLFIEEAPEANDVDWEFIHINTNRKIYARIKGWGMTLLFIAMCFFTIWIMSSYQGELIEQTYEQMAEGNVNFSMYYLVKFYSFFISMGIVLFNKFCLGKVFHLIVDTEYYSTKTKFNIAFATKLTIALFCNSALITYFAEILKNDNYYGPGGFIYTETWVFIWNCFVPPLVWLTDPWTQIKNKERKQALKDQQENKCFLTQEQANKLMEGVEYTQGKRYADMMKTLWFTFFYAPCIPLGLLFSMITLILYFWVDYYNVVHRRTIKESLSKDVSIEMIENLEMSLLFFAIGNVTFSLQLFNEVEVLSIIQLVIAIIYAILPMQEINEKIWNIERIDEKKPYEVSEIEFMTDYDRQNPITKKFALKRIQMLLKKRQFEETQRLNITQQHHSQPQHSQN